MSERPLLDALEPRRLLAAPPPVPPGTPWGAAPRLTRLDQLAALHPELDGAGQTIAVIDTGIDYTHPNLGGGFGPGNKVIGGYDFVDDDEIPMDTDGHGTAVAGVIAADAFMSGGFAYRGVAPGARLVALRIAPDTSQVPLSRIEAALQWVVANNPTYHFSAVNLSFGFGRFDSSFNDPTLSDDLASVAALGIAFVSSAGNGGVADGPGITYPAADPTAISVGSVNGSDAISEFSQRSINLDLLAVGEGVRTTGLDGTFVNVTGTSFAAPAVAGTVGLIRQADPTFTLADLRSIFRASSAGNYDGDLETGDVTGLTFRRLDVLGAANFALQRKAVAPDQAYRVGFSGNGNDLTYDAEGVLHFAWYDSNARLARYATRSVNGKWSTPIDVDGRLEVGSELSLRLDSRGRPVIAYKNGPNGELDLAQFDGSSWQNQTIDDKSGSGLYPSLAIDPQDRLYIAHYRKSTADLRIASFDGTAWTRETIDSDGTVGVGASLALDAQQRPAVGYGDLTRNQLKLARLGRDGTWSIQVADADAQGVDYVSLAFDGAGRPAMSVYESGPADLKYAAMVGTAWRVTRVASKGTTGLYSNLALDEEGLPTILFWDKKQNALLLATTSDGTRFGVERIDANEGKYVRATRSPLNGRWTYTASKNGRLVAGEI